MDGLLLFMAIGLLLLIGQIAAIISIFGRTDAQVAGNSRVLWAIVVLFIPFAWVVYFLKGRRPTS